ncbi:MAG: two-component system NtrC family sensor kinase [Planctomycetota bacterium]
MEKQTLTGEFKEINFNNIKLEGLNARESELESLFDSLPSVLIVVDAQLSIRRWNQKAEECFGLTGAEVIGRHLGECGIRWEMGTIESCFAGLLDGTQRRKGLLVFQSNTGSKRTLGLKLVALPPSGCALPQILILGRDITESLAQGELHRRLITAVEQASDSMLIAGSTGTIRYGNPAYGRATGYHRVDWQEGSHNLLKCRSSFPTESAYQIFRDTLDRGEVWSGHMTSQRKDGSTFEEDVTITPLRNEVGQPVGFVSVSKDVTERLSMEVQLRSAQKLESIGQLAAGIAHEINTPTQFVSDNMRFLTDAFEGLASLLKLCAGVGQADGCLPDPAGSLKRIAQEANRVDIGFVCDEIPGALKESLGGLDRISEIISAMKTFSHPGVVEKVPVDLNEVIRTTMVLSSNEWKYVAEIQTDFDENLEPVDGLPGELGQVILNLIVNAAHAIDELKAAGLGTITLRTRKHGDCAQIEISDTGCGMPEDVALRIYDPFYTTKEVGRGTGQGLAIARSVVVDKHAGEITVETIPGKGSTFKIIIPTKESPSGFKETLGDKGRAA